MYEQHGRNAREKNGRISMFKVHGESCGDSSEETARRKSSCMLRHIACGGDESARCVSLKGVCGGYHIPTRIDFR